MLNTGISGVLGVGFWLAAARYYSADSVGQGSAAIAAMKFLAGLTAVTLTGALARFIPIAGRRTGSFIFRTYAGSSLAVACAALVFLLTLDVWGPSYRFLHGPVNGLGFIAAVVAWSLLTLQDGVLTGLRSALWVPVGNTVFSTVKLGLLIAFAVAIPTTGVFVSWVVAIATSVIPLGWLVFRRLVPRHVELTAHRTKPPTLREVGRFLAGDYTGSLFSLAVVYLVPVLIASQVSSADNAYFYITTTIGGTVNLLAINMGASLTVEGSHDPAQLAANTRAALRRMARIMLPICGLLFLAAPLVLHVFGDDYAHAATPLLRWFAVGAALRVVMETYFAVLRAQSRTAGLAWLQGLLCVLVLGLTLLLLPRMGLTGAGVAEISSLAVIVALAAPKLYRIVRTAPPAPAVVGAPDGDLADLGTPDRTTGAKRQGPGQALRGTLDSDTLHLAVQLNLDHQERRPDVRPGPATPAHGTPSAGGGEDDMGHRPTWALKSPPAPRPPAEPEPASASATSETSATSEASDTSGINGTSDTSGAFDTAVPAPPATPAATPRTLRDRLALLSPRVVVLALLLVAALGLYWGPVLGLSDGDLDGMGGLGLISVLPPATLLGAALLIGVFASLLWLERPHKWLLLLTLLATVVSLHALPAVIEAEPRFATAWQHLGFMEYIDRTGSAVPDLDARWSWPGFFAAATFVAKACGVTDMTEVIRWWPLAMQLLYLAPMFLLTRSMRASWRARWTGLWIFVLSGWVGQDYFPAGLHVPPLPGLRRHPAGVVPGAEGAVDEAAARRAGGRTHRPAPAGGAAARPDRPVRGDSPGPPAHPVRDARGPRGPGARGPLRAARPADPVRGPGRRLGLVPRGAVLVGPLRRAVRRARRRRRQCVVVGLRAYPGGSSAHKLVLYARVLLAGGVMAFACWGWWRRRDAKYRERSSSSSRSSRSWASACSRTAARWRCASSCSRCRARRCSPGSRCSRAPGSPRRNATATG